MKKILIGIVAMASFIFTANSQENGKMKHHKRHHGRSMMMKELNLSAAQKDQMKATRENTKKQLMELNKNENITVKEYNSRKEAIQKSQKDQMKGMLTTEQKNQLARKKVERKAAHDLHAAKKLDKMKKNLNLSDDQATKIKANREASRAKAAAIKENSQLSKIEKKEQLMALKQMQKDNLIQLLTPEQIDKMEEIRKNKPEKTRRK